MRRAVSAGDLTLGDEMTYQGWKTRGYDPTAYLDYVPRHRDSQREWNVLWTVPQVHREAIDAREDDVRP